ncbi:protein STRUBBELIG-RECEPTOR FAMILY 6-like [Papaver somniferum]|nr:protein STRUBBELIG-RECEPTOR FAMILY 6-like [Papaver somniferum]XP_026390354.1 protein STRUBBELIG-RECEPTOR FAMILY 6-like [Papaver somniferum]
MFLNSSRSRSEQSLARWATSQLHDIDALDKMVDASLKGHYPPKSVSRFADVVSLRVQSEPESRPPMSEVVHALVRLVQRANMSKRNIGEDRRSEDPDVKDDMY